MIRLPLLLALLVLVLAGPATAMVRLPAIPVPVAGNPADRLLSVPIEESVYDGVEANARGVFWGSYRCEKWGKGQASLHAEKRAIDWHLDASVPADARAVEELIRDCGYWSAGMTQFSEYGPCYGKRGKLKRKLNATVAHRDHVHIGMTKRGAAAQTSFWSRGR